MALLDELQTQSASLKSLMPPIQLYKEFIVTYKIMLNVSIMSHLNLAIKELRSRCENIEAFRTLYTKKGKGYTEAKFSFYIKVRLLDKSELENFIDAIAEMNNIGGSLWYNNNGAELYIQKCHEKFFIKYDYKPYDEVAKVVFEQND